jgi:hypothetical protein
MRLTCFDEETLKAADLVGFHNNISLLPVLKTGMMEANIPLMDEEGHPSGNVDISMRMIVGKSVEEKKAAAKGIKTMLDVQVQTQTLDHTP